MKSRLFLLVFTTTALLSRNIAILGYGSLIKHPKRSWAELKINGEFKKTNFTLPIGLTRASAWKEYPSNPEKYPNRKLTVIIDQKATKKGVYFATSKFKSLPKVRENMAKREASVKKYMAYVRQLKPGQQKGQIEDFAYIYQGNKWTGIILQLPKKDAQKIVRWAAKNNFDAVVWTSLPATLSNKKNIEQMLRQDKTLLKNTQSYITLLPDDLLTPFLKRILQWQQ